MPKLTAEVAATATELADEWGDRRPLAPGLYIAKLLEVTAEQKAAGPCWSWKYSIPPTDAFVWDNTSLSAKAIGRLGKVFQAFGVSTDTDTKFLIGQSVCLQIGQYTVAEGKNRGKIQNSVDGVLPVTEHPDYDPTEGGKKASAADFGADDGLDDL